MDLTICIVNWNTGKLLQKCLMSICEKTKGITFEIVIVDNNSTDDSVKIVKNKFPDCKLILNDKNIGFTKANNQGMKIAKGKYLVFCNPDTELITNAFAGMFFFLENNVEYGAVGCKLVNTDGTIQPTCARTYPTILNQFCYFFYLHKLFPKKSFFSNEDLEYWDHEESRDIDVISGACLMTDREMVIELEGFDENIFMYSEDVDLCFRIRKAGRRIFYLSSETIVHHSGASSNKKKDLYFVPVMLRNGHHYFIKKHFGLLRAFQYRLIVLGGSIVRTIVMLAFIALSVTYEKESRDQIYTALLKNLGSFLWALFILRRPRKNARVFS